MAWANPKVIPASCAHLDRGAIKAGLVEHDGNISAAAKKLRVPAPDLRKLVWQTDLADVVYEQIEQGLDEAQAVLREALSGPDKTHQLQAAKTLLTQSVAGRRRGWGAALLDVEPEPRPAAVIKWLEH
jgi:hypothetical protein